MSENKFKLSDAARIAVAAARAVYGDMSGVAVEASLRSKKLLKAIAVITLGLLLFFTTAVAALMELIPGFETIYKMYRVTHPPPRVISYTFNDTLPPNTSDIYFPIPSGYSVSFN